MKIGVTPFFSRNRKRLLNNIANEDVIYPNKEKYNIEYSDLFMDFVNNVCAQHTYNLTFLQLLKKDKKERLGVKGGADEILSHPWFSNIDIAALKKKEIKAPFIPELENIEDLSNFQAHKDKESLAESHVPKSKLEKIKEHKQAFDGF